MIRYEGLKYLYIILSLLCSWMFIPMTHAQIYTTSSASYRSFSTSGMATQPTTSAFRSTSVYRSSDATTSNISSSISYSTAPMRVSNGFITTVASELQGGVLTEQYEETGTGSQSNNAIIPGVPDTPIGFGWDVVLLLAILSMGYALCIRHQKRKQITNQ